KILPNETDLSAFKGDGLPGLNFAFIEGVAHYHTAADNLEAVDESSLQHHGTYALSLARHFGNLDLTNVTSSDAVYFNLFGFTLVRYSSLWILPLAILATLLFVGVVVIGFKRGHLSLSGIGLGFVALLIGIIVSAAAVTIAWWLIRTVHPAYRAILQGDTYNSETYMIAFAALSLALTSALYGFFRRFVTIENLSVGALCWWLLLTLVTSVVLPGGSFLFLWPLLFSSLTLGVLFWGREEKPALVKRVAVLT